MLNYQLLPQRLTPTEKLTQPTFIFWVSILLFLVVVPTNVFGQKATSDDKDMSINVTSYFFAYDMKFEDGSGAVGPTLSLNTNGKISVQFGLLLGTKKYTYYVKNGAFSYTPFEKINLFFPLTIQYNYFNSDKVELYLIGGFIFGGRNIIGDNDRTVETSIFNLTFGTGISYRPLRWLELRTYPTIRYNLEYFSPGVSVDVAYMFSSKKWVDM